MPPDIVLNNPSLPFGRGFPRIPQSYDATVRNHRFLYRVHNATSDSPLDDELGFIATTFQRIASETTLQQLRRRPESAVGDLRSKAVKHVGKCNRSIPDMSAILTPFVSTSFSLPYAIWEASRRGNSWISVIDGYMLLGCAWIALELLDVEHEAERCFANESQEVLVWANVPRQSIVASDSWKTLLDALPSWTIDLKYNIPFLRYTTSQQCCKAFVSAAANVEEESQIDPLEEVVGKAMTLFADTKAKASNSTTKTELRYNTDMVSDFATYLYSWLSWIRGERMDAGVRGEIVTEVEKELNVHQHFVRIKKTKWLEKELRGIVQGQLEGIDLEVEQAMELDCSSEEIPELQDVRSRMVLILSLLNDGGSKNY